MRRKAVPSAGAMPNALRTEENGTSSVASIGQAHRARLARRAHDFFKFEGAAGLDKRCNTPQPLSAASRGARSNPRSDFGMTVRRQRAKQTSFARYRGGDSAEPSSRHDEHEPLSSTDARSPSQRRAEWSRVT